MADIPPPNPPSGPTGAVPPPKKETGKVQPKKETVRINLPPKPTAAPTIKLPTLPPGGPTGAPSAAPALATAHAAPPPAPKTSGAPGTSIAKPAQAPAQQRPSTMQRQVAPAVPTVKALDKVLIYATLVAVVGGLGFYCYVTFLVLKPAIDNFQP
ncbi:MAG TPA: hypothetical protein VL970_00970 [Candidatus Acidoferrales bacterium]|nr:hypothetical protein [Candidatus Acidoferrales bacterium]